MNTGYNILCNTNLLLSPESGIAIAYYIAMVSKLSLNRKGQQMITKQQLKAGRLYYSDFGDRSWLIVRPLKITKTKKQHFWFDAEVIDNSGYTGTSKDRNAIGTVHCFSNAFMYLSFADLVAGTKKYIDVQIKVIRKVFGMDKIDRALTQ